MNTDKKRSDISDLKKLIDACKLNDRRAQLELYDLFAQTMYNTSYRLLRNKMDAEDTMQEAFISAFGKIDSFRNEVPFDAWLRRIVINKSLDSLRKRKQLFSDISEDLPDESTIEEDFAYKRSMQEQLMNSLKQLSEGYRVIVSLFYFEGYDHDEIAHILNISPSTSRSQLARAKKKLKENLQPKTKK